MSFVSGPVNFSPAGGQTGSGVQVKGPGQVQRVSPRGEECLAGSGVPWIWVGSGGGGGDLAHRSSDLLFMMMMMPVTWDSGGGG